MKQNVTEAQAKNKWCRHRIDYCIASECMDWSWADSKDRDPDDEKYVPKGYCGVSDYNFILQKRKEDL